MSQQQIPDFDDLIEQWRSRWQQGGGKKISGAFSLLLGGILFVVLLVIIASTFFITHEFETVIITRFEKVVQTKAEAGIGMKIPFIDKVERIDMRARSWDGRAADMTTRDKLYIKVNSFARWRVSDPREFLESVSNDERRAISRINGILDSETRTQVGANRLVEVIRSTKGREPFFPDDIEPQERSVFEPILNGRVVLEERISESAREKLKDIGVELLEFYLKRVNYNEEVQRNVEARMISERMRIASRFRAEGDEQASIIDGRKERELLSIESEAFRRAEEIRGEAEQVAYQIYNEAYAATPQHREFYSFLKRMDSYEQSLTGSVFFLQTDNPYLSALSGGLGMGSARESQLSQQEGGEVEEAGGDAAAEQSPAEPPVIEENQQELEAGQGALLDGQAKGQDLGQIVIDLSLDGIISVDGENISAEELEERLKRVASVYPNQPVILRAKEGTKYAALVNLVKTFSKAEMDNVTFAIAPSS